MRTSATSLFALFVSAPAVVVIGLSSLSAFAQPAAPSPARPQKAGPPGGVVEAEPGQVDLLANPFNKPSAHHRPIGTHKDVEAQLKMIVPLLWPIDNTVENEEFAGGGKSLGGINTAWDAGK